MIQTVIMKMGDDTINYALNLSVIQKCIYKFEGICGEYMILKKHYTK